MNAPVTFPDIQPAGADRPRANHVIPRATIEAIVAFRNRALELYSAAYDKMLVASLAVQAANAEARKATIGDTRYNVHTKEEKSKPWLNGKDLPPRDDYLKKMRRIVDIDVWSHVIKISELETVMDKTAKDQMHQDLLGDNPPEATVDNIRATLQQFLLDADFIFKRGIATCFSKLDRRFRSHDGWKIGSRVILSYAFDEYGWRYSSGHDDTLRDIERTFLTLDGRKTPLYGGIVDQIRGSRHAGRGAHQSEFQNDYFTIRGFKNGNCHVWFERDDLLEKVNKLLGEFYDAPIPEDREPDIFTGLNDPKRSLAKNYGFFPTPNEPAKEVIDKASLYQPEGKLPLKVLEPSAGTGNLARLAADKGCTVDCVEFQAPLADKLRQTRRYRAVHNIDFLALKPGTTGLYDRVVMNPPFDRERDIDHVMHALKFLEPDGMLIAIMSAGTEFRETRKSVAFRDLVAKMRGRFTDLPEGSFRSVGTNCNTIILRVRKDGRGFW